MKVEIKSGKVYYLPWQHRGRFAGYYFLYHFFAWLRDERIGKTLNKGKYIVVWKEENGKCTGMNETAVCR